MPVSGDAFRRPRRALERAPRRSAARGRATAEFHLEGRQQRGCGARGESEARRGGVGPGTGDPGEDLWGGGGHGGPTTVRPRPLVEAGPAARAAALHRRALGRWAAEPLGLGPLRFGRARPRALNGTRGCNRVVPSVGMGQPNNRDPRTPKRTVLRPFGDVHRVAGPRGHRLGLTWALGGRNEGGPVPRGP
ncbi:hypothetical protein NDU88_004001 [Pleurodeles waltl]|uniref:Uncharacterized protein n=1 Tax=Pleurodeles waltl TaxID=8319 RepID=A0AAV7QBA9_PLEWA|nr:hypothetical protein NDU88_004001 [Pleurodeles waltl]